jgi:uncharacterized protein YdiU (UPF0061 family)
MTRYDPEHICNHSDDSGRYTYEAQPDICYWNCEKLAAALASVLDISRARAELRSLYSQEFAKCAHAPLPWPVPCSQYLPADMQKAACEVHTSGNAHPSLSMAG